MSSTSPKITFSYNFIADKTSITNKDKSDISKILTADATLSIKINDALYLETKLAILEFYKALQKWTEQVTDQYLPIFII